MNTGSSGISAGENRDSRPTPRRPVFSGVAASGWITAYRAPPERAANAPGDARGRAGIQVRSTPEVKHRGRHMSAVMDASGHARIFLRGRDRACGRRTRPEDIETRRTRAGKHGQPRASRCSVELMAKQGREISDRSADGAALGNRGFPRNTSAKPVFHNTASSRSGPRVDTGFQWAGVSRTQSPSDADELIATGFGGAVVDDIRSEPATRYSNRGLFGQRRLVDQHDRIIVPDGVKAMAGDAAKALAIGLQFHFCPARRAR